MRQRGRLGDYSTFTSIRDVVFTMPNDLDDYVVFSACRSDARVKKPHSDPRRIYKNMTI